MELVKDHGTRNWMGLNSQDSRKILFLWVKMPSRKSQNSAHLTEKLIGTEAPTITLKLLNMHLIWK